VLAIQTLAWRRVDGEGRALAATRADLLKLFELAGAQLVAGALPGVHADGERASGLLLHRARTQRTSAPSSSNRPSEVWSAVGASNKQGAMRFACPLAPASIRSMFGAAASSAERSDAEMRSATAARL
jgi:hypothetical protein